ncbi:MAG: ATP-binding cassette domain-containing protein [Gemmatimonadota bacterium]
MTALLELAAISRRFGAVQALHDAAFVLQPGQLHALLGENGAGKSTLMRIVNGMIRPDRGSFLVHGQPVAPASPREARALGIGMVHQHFSAVPAFTVGQNIALAAGWSPAPNDLRTRLRALMTRVGFELDPGQRSDSLTVAQRQALEILMALAGEARVLLLDEPTGVLAAADADRVLTVVREFTRQGGGAVLITHKLEEALRHADQITVLRRGEVSLHGPAAELTAAKLEHAMLGDAPPAASPLRRTVAGPIVARCSNLIVPAEAGGTGLRGVTLEMRGGEIVGVAAVEDNGERELLRTLGGLLSPASGFCEVLTSRTLIPEDRTTEALIPSFSLTENRLLAGGAQSGSASTWINWDRERLATEALIAANGVVAAGANATAEELSGGNQQRFVIARQLESAPGLIVAENPSRGLDFKAAADVFDRLRNAAGAGAAVIFHSVDLDEVLANADRVVVLHQGQLAAPAAGADRDEIGRLMLAGSAGPSA